MKKAFRTFTLVLTLILSLQTVAFAYSNNTLKSGTKSTPYGDMEGGIVAYYYGEIDIWLYAYTEIDSPYTMAEITAKLDVRVNDTGELLDQSSKTDYDVNTVESYADANRFYGKLALFSTHEVTYTKSYVLYLSTTLDP